MKNLTHLRTTTGLPCYSVRWLARLPILAVIGLLAAWPVWAADEKQEVQSGFETSDGQDVSSSEFIKLLKDKLDTRYQDLEIVIKSCYSGEFVTRAAGTNGLSGNWSLSTSSDTNHPTTNGRTPGDKDIPQGPGGKITGLHYGGYYYYGFAAQYIKQLLNAPNTSNKGLYQAANDNDIINGVPPENPQYGSSGTNADNTTVHGGTKSNHAIIFSEPATYGDRLTEELYNALKGAGYTDADIDYLRDDDQELVGHNATLQDLKDALDRLNTVLTNNLGEEKAYIFVDAHGSYEIRDVAYLPHHTLGVPLDGLLVSYPSGTVVIDADATLVGLLAEEAPRSTGGFWADEPELHRVAQPTLRFTTVAESFSGSAIVNLSLNQVPLGSFRTDRQPSRGRLSGSHSGCGAGRRVEQPTGHVQPGCSVPILQPRRQFQAGH